MAAEKLFFGDSSMFQHAFDDDHADDDGDIHDGTAPDVDPSRRRERVEQAMSREQPVVPLPVDAPAVSLTSHRFLVSCEEVVNEGGVFVVSGQFAVRFDLYFDQFQFRPFCFLEFWRGAFCAQRNLRRGLDVLVTANDRGSRLSTCLHVQSGLHSTITWQMLNLTAQKRDGMPAPRHL